MENESGLYQTHSTYFYKNKGENKKQTKANKKIKKNKKPLFLYDEMVPP